MKERINNIFVGEKREIINPPPETIFKDILLVDFYDSHKYITGVNSALVKEKGNLHFKIKSLR